MPDAVKPIFEFGAYRLDVAGRQLKRAGEPVQLAPKIFELLVFMLENSGRPISKDELLNKVWPDSFVSEENLSRHISTLRKNLSEGGDEQKYIETLPKFGYRFTELVNSVAAEPVITPVPAGPQDFAGFLGAANFQPQPVDYAEPLLTQAPAQAPAQAPVAAPEVNEFPTELSAYEPRTNPVLLAAAVRPRQPFSLAALALLVVAGLGVTFGVFKLAARQPDSAGTVAATPRMVPFTSYLNRENYPAFSPDDKMLAFTWDGEDGQNTDIYVKLLDSGAPLRLTTDPAADISPVWSPDGRSIAFLRLTDNGAAIYQVSALGGSERVLTAGFWAGGMGVPAGRLSWSPDGKYIVFAGTIEGKQQDLHLFQLTLATGEKRQLTNSTEDDRCPVLSPDGRTLVFIRGLDEIYSLPTGLAEGGEAGGEARRLTFDNKRIFGLAWTPDSRALIFSSARGGDSRLWKIAVTGGTPEVLTPGGEQVGNLAVSHQGKQLIYAQNISDSNIWQLTLTGAAGAPPAPSVLIASTRKDNQPQFSPDGKRIVFVSQRSGNLELWTSNSEGRDLTQLTNINGPHVGSPRWSPDGQQIAFDSTANADLSSIYVISASSGSARRLTVEAAHESKPCWSRDGQWLYFRSNRNGAFQIWKQPFSGGAAVLVAPHNGTEFYESADGQFLYYSKKPDEPGIWRVPVGGGPETQVLAKGRQGEWTLQAQGIFLISPGTQPRATLEFFSLATSQTKPIAVFEKWTANGLSASPDGRKILWSQIDRNESDLLLLENFR